MFIGSLVLIWLCIMGILSGQPIWIMTGWFCILPAIGLLIFSGVWAIFVRFTARQWRKGSRYGRYDY